MLKWTMVKTLRVESAPSKNPLHSVQIQLRGTQYPRVPKKIVSHLETTTFCSRQIGVLEISCSSASRVLEISCSSASRVLEINCFSRVKHFIASNLNFNIFTKDIEMKCWRLELSHAKVFNKKLLEKLFLNIFKFKIYLRS